MNASCYDFVYVFNICRIRIYVKDMHFKGLRGGQLKGFFDFFNINQKMIMQQPDSGAIADKFADPKRHCSCDRMRAGQARVPDGTIYTLPLIPASETDRFKAVVEMNMRDGFPAAGAGRGIKFSCNGIVGEKKLTGLSADGKAADDFFCRRPDMHGCCGLQADLDAVFFKQIIGFACKFCGNRFDLGLPVASGAFRKPGFFQAVLHLLLKTLVILVKICNISFKPTIHACAKGFELVGNKPAGGLLNVICQ
jgi:hypothetical protein